MSASKGFETKIHDDENADSGFLSGPIDQFPSELEEDHGELESDKQVSSEPDEVVNPDSGVSLCTDRLETLHLGLQTPTAPTVRVTHSEEIPNKDLPPIAILFQQDDDGDTQLHIAAVHGCQKSVRTLIRVCPDKCWLDLPNDYGHTALHLAVMSGHAVVAKMLVLSGASLDVRDLTGNTPVHTATAARSVECLQALLGSVDNQRKLKSRGSVLNIYNYNGQTCVHIAASLGHFETLHTLAYYGADVNAKEGYAGWTALHIAAHRGDLSLAQSLLYKCPGVDHAARDYAERTPRRLAKRSHAFSTKEGQRIFKVLPEESDSETDDDDEYDSEDGESLYEKYRSKTVAAPMVN